MEQPVRATSEFRRGLDQFLWASTIALTGSLLLVGNHWLAMNRSAIETRFFPAVTDYTFQDWKHDPTTGYPSAKVFMFKVRGECVYAKDQIETALGVTPAGDIVEAVIDYVGDPSPGSNRAEGWQRLDARVVYMSDAFVLGTLIRGSVIHGCHKGTPTVSFWGPAVVGEDMPLPPYVEAWIAAGREGIPQDYR
jgi:hypothetical protein